LIDRFRHELEEIIDEEDNVKEIQQEKNERIRRK
jgi:hypothetical protein